MRVSEKKHPLPEGWRYAPLGELGSYINGRAFKPTEWEEKGRPIIRIQDLTGTGKRPNLFSGRVDPKHVIRRGDLLVAWSASLGAFIWDGPEAVLNQHIFRVDSLIDKRYHYYALLSVIDDLYRQAHGSGMVHVTKKKFEATPVALAPARQQQEIVDAIETHFTRLDAAIALLKRVQANLKRYRASVLKAAVEGRLVPTEAELARQEGRDYEPASVLLERILKERRRRWEEAELAKMKAKGKAPKDDKWKAKYKEPKGPDVSALPELPEGWCCANLGQIKEFSLYGPRFSSDLYASDGKLILRTTDISESGHVDHESAPRIRLDDDAYEKFRVCPGDLLVTRTGSIGTVAVLADDVRAIAGAYLIQYRLAAPHPTTWYAFYFLKSPVGQEQLRQGTAGVGRPNLNAPTIEAIPIPVPPLAEQKSIIKEVEARLSLIEAERQQVQTNQRRLERLRQAVLRWAFTGRL